MKLVFTLAILCVAAILLISSSMNQVLGQNVVQYQVQIASDSSASWSITQALSSNSTPDSWAGFQQRVETLVSSATTQTGRNMSIDANSFQITIQEASVEYQFVWLDFSVIRNENISFGDVFRVNNFFGELYGNGIIQVNYPSSFTIESVSPPPNKRDDVQKSLEWLNTQSFATQNPSIILAASSAKIPPSPSESPNQILSNGGIPFVFYAGASSFAILAVIVISFFVVRRRKQRLAKSKPNPVAEPLIESEEEKIIKVIRSNGNQMFQAEIAEQCRFSKAKVSQLLSALEKKRVVRRYKKGRDKIVTLTEK